MPIIFSYAILAHSAEWIPLFAVRYPELNRISPLASDFIVFSYVV